MYHYICYNCGLEWETSSEHENICPLCGEENIDNLSSDKNTKEDNMRFRNQKVKYLKRLRRKYGLLSDKNWEFLKTFEPVKIIDFTLKDDNETVTLNVEGTVSYNNWCLYGKIIDNLEIIINEIKEL